MLEQVVALKQRMGQLMSQIEPLRRRSSEPGARAELQTALNELEDLADRLKDSMLEIESQGAVVKDLDLGLLDFPAIIGGEAVYLCWRLGEERIGFYHGVDEGFRGRRPLPH